MFHSTQLTIAMILQQWNVPITFLTLNLMPQSTLTKEAVKFIARKVEERFRQQFSGTQMNIILHHININWEVRMWLDRKGI
jgi:hypothetical protein